MSHLEENLKTLKNNGFGTKELETIGSWSQYQQMFGGKGKMFGNGEDGKLTDLTPGPKKYKWSINNMEIATGVKTLVSLPLGLH